MDKKGGWIKLYRSINENWVTEYKEPKCHAWAWVDLLLMANHESQDVIINGSIVEIKRGQKLTSILRLSERWGWSRGKTQRFLEMLKSASMIYYDSDTTNGTLITIVNYDNFQGLGTADSTTDGQRTDSGRTAGGQRTGHKQEYKNNKNDKEGKNNKERRPWGGRLEPE